jgi:hypothetical protein
MTMTADEILAIDGYGEAWVYSPDSANQLIGFQPKQIDRKLIALAKMVRADWLCCLSFSGVHDCRVFVSTKGLITEMSGSKVKEEWDKIHVVERIARHPFHRLSFWKKLFQWINQ